MKYAFIADIHANLEALEAVLTDARAQGVGHFVFLGDFVGYGPDPVAVVERCAGLVAIGQAHALLGNHDSVVCGREPSIAMNQDARHAMLWTRAQLQAAHQHWLTDLPLRIDHEGMCWVHASAHMPEKWIYVQYPQQAELCLREAGSTWVFAGHMHPPRIFYSARNGRYYAFRPHEGHSLPLSDSRRWMCIIGATGQPRDGTRGARYAIFDRETARYTLRRVPYNQRLTLDKMHAAALPPRLGRYLQGRR